MIPITTPGATAMLVKKAVYGKLGWLLISGRLPSLHSGLALVWIGLGIALALSGLVIYTGGRRLQVSESIYIVSIMTRLLTDFTSKCYDFLNKIMMM